MIFRCNQFLQMSVTARRSRASELKLCFNCLSPGHRVGAATCRGKGCKQCNYKKHNGLLCVNGVPSASVSNAVAQVQAAPGQAMISAEQLQVALNANVAPFNPDGSPMYGANFQSQRKQNF